MITRPLFLSIFFLLAAQPASAGSLGCWVREVHRFLNVKRPPTETVVKNLIVSETTGFQEKSPIAPTTEKIVMPAKPKVSRRETKFKEFAANNQMVERRRVPRSTESVDVETTDPDIFLDTDRFEQISKIRKQRGEHESHVTLNSFEAARNYVQKFPALRARGFAPEDYSGWTKVYSRLSHSSFFGKFVGWEKRLGNGDFARYRYDYEPESGVHWNIEISTHNAQGNRETSKLAVRFLCSGHKCSEQEAKNYLIQMNR